jgi:2-polyprenyl-6-methoxyphenol hydroxylase-like FAD-dependent oxidoreductase
MRIVSVGGGIVGLTTAMLLARDGHDVTVLERDEATPPRSAGEAWEDWERRGVNQFRLSHFIQPGFHGIADREMPELLGDLTDAGALRFNALELVPQELSGGVRESDEEYTALTGRRPVVEAAVAARAAATDNIEIRRGAPVAGLVVAEASDNGKAPHVIGVRLESGEEVTGDLVLDLGGRRSALPRWLEEIGAAPMHEELEDSGFTYYGRHFRSADGSTPPMIGPLAMDYGSVSVLTLPADNGTWGCVIVTVGGDAPLRGLRHTDRWTAAMQSFPLQAHWVDGEPLEDGIISMTKIEDRRRRWVVDGQPVATGVAPVGDAWACTNPSLGRGVTIGAHHAVALRDLLREADPSEPTEFALAWQHRTDEAVGEWYDATLAYDRNRLAEASAAIEGKAFEPDNELWHQLHALGHGGGSDPDLFRAMFDIIGVIRPPSVVFGNPDIAAKVDSIGDSYKEAEYFGPTRDDIVAIANG